MSTTRMQSQILAALLGLLGTTFLLHSLTVHPQDKGDQPSATQSQSGGDSGGASGKESTDSSAGASTKEAAGASGGKLTDRDERMLIQMAQSHMGEINLGKLAQDKAKSDEVKSFAKKMVDDHTKALDELKQMADAKGVKLPEEPGKKQMAMEKKLQELSGAKFDRQYMQQAGKQAHQETHKLLQRAASRAEDSDLKNYASKAIGTVESHMELAKETTENMKASSQGQSSSEQSSGDSKGGSESSGGSKSEGESSGKSSSGSTSSSSQ